MLRNAKNLNEISAKMVGERLTEKLGDKVEYTIGSIVNEFKILVETPAGVKGIMLTPEDIDKYGAAKCVATYMESFATEEYNAEDINWSDYDDAALRRILSRRENITDHNVAFTIFVDEETSIRDSISNQVGNRIYISCNDKPNAFSKATLIS